jgi:chitodextrinase
VDPGNLLTTLLGLLNPLINLTVLPNPAVTKTGSRPTPYYIPAAGSSLIDAGRNVGFLFGGSAPDIGAYESDSILAPNDPPLVNILNPANNASYPVGSSVTIATNASDRDGTIAKVEFFNEATKLGEVTTSPYNFVWTNVAAGNYSVTVKATDNQGGVTLSDAVTFIVGNSNAAPLVSITSPANQASFTAGSTITITATASDADGQISKVEFFNDTTKLGEADTAPYTFVWTNVQEGTYSLTARATDNENATTESIIVWIIVGAVKNMPPIISITSPANHASFTAGSTVTIHANASDTDGTITKVEFFQGTTKLGEDMASPYSFAWDSVAAGSYSLTAKATDNLGALTTSTPVLITVTLDTLINPRISIYPNPAKTEFTIEYVSAIVQQAQVFVYDLSSKITKQLLVTINIGRNDIPVDIADLSNGIYIVVVITDKQKFSQRLAILH